jgi:predicted membrane protein
MFNLCAPALIYLAFSLTQIIIDTFRGMYNTAIIKCIVAIIITILLNALCETGMGIVSWIIVFIPFIFMSLIVAILLYTFGLDPATGKLNVVCSNCDKQTKTNKKSETNKTSETGNLIYMSKPNKYINKNNCYMDVTYSDSPATYDEVNTQND